MTTRDLAWWFFLIAIVGASKQSRRSLLNSNKCLLNLFHIKTTNRNNIKFSWCQIILYLNKIYNNTNNRINNSMIIKYRNLMSLPFNSWVNRIRRGHCLLQRNLLILNLVLLRPSLMNCLLTIKPWNNHSSISLKWINKNSNISHSHPNISMCGQWMTTPDPKFSIRAVN